MTNTKESNGSDNRCPEITREQFIEEYCRRSGVAYEDFTRRGIFAGPCTCSQKGCLGWQMVGSHPEARRERAAVIAYLNGFASMADGDGRKALVIAADAIEKGAHIE